MPKRKWWKIALIIVGVLLFLPVFPQLIFFVYLHLTTKDIPPIDDSALRLKIVSMANDENAYYDLEKAGEVYVKMSTSSAIDQMISGESWDDKLAEECLSKNARSLQLLLSAAHKSKYQDPAYADPVKITFDAQPDSKAPKVQLGKLMALQSVKLSKQGHDKEAIETAFALIKLGQKIQESQAELIHNMVARVMKRLGLIALQTSLNKTTVKSQELVRYAKSLGEFYNNEEGLKNAFKIECAKEVNRIDALALGDKNALDKSFGDHEGLYVILLKISLKNNYMFQPVKTKKPIIENYRTAIENVDKIGKEIKPEAQKEITSLEYFYKGENPIGKILSSVYFPKSNALIARKQEDDFTIAATQAMFAIKAFKNDKGKYPEKLEALVPHYLATVPTDPYDGMPLKYSAEKKTLYSSLQSALDSGTAEDYWKSSKPPTFKLNF